MKTKKALGLCFILIGAVMLSSTVVYGAWYNGAWIKNPDVASATRLGSIVTYGGISAYKDSYLGNKYWQASPDTTNRDWATAKTYCAGLGDKAWRLPTIEELYSLTTYTIKNSNSAYSVHPALTHNYYWSSTEYAPSTTTAWYVNFSYGNTYSNPKSCTYRVVCIHD